MSAAAVRAERPCPSARRFPGRRLRRSALGLGLCALVALAPPAAHAHGGYPLASDQTTGSGYPEVTVTVEPGSGQLTVAWQRTGGGTVASWNLSIDQGTKDDFDWYPQMGAGTTSVTKTATQSGGALTNAQTYWVVALFRNAGGSHRYARQVTVGADTTAPAYSSAAVNGTTLTVTFGEALATDHTPDAADFTVAGGDAPTPAVTAVAFKSGDATKVELTLGRAVKFGETGIRLSYTPHATDTAKRLQDVNANEVAGFTNRRVTNRTPDPNNAPRVLEQQSPVGGNACKVKTDAGPQRPAVAAASLADVSPLTTRTSTDTAEFPASCTRAANKVAPVFDDRDGDRLTITMSYTIPDNVFVVDEPELVQPSAPDDLNNGGELKRTGKLFFSGQAAREQTDVRIDLTATDPSGATASTHVLFRVFDPGAGTSAPSLPAVAAKRVELHERASIKLPAATGGDVMVETASGDDTELVGGDAVGTRTVFYDYRYAASGLPAGLAFDADTRTISGTPTATGSFTVTYTAEDADGTLTDADKASRTFTLEVFDDTAPALQSATVNGANLVLTYDETLAGSAPPAAAFAVTVAGANRGVSSVSLSGSAVTLTLASAVAAGQIVAVSYTAANAGAQPIRDAAGNNSADLTSRAVESGSAGARNFADAGLGNGAPNTPSSATATPGPGAGGITVTWTHATTGPAAVRWKVEARPAGTTSWSGLAGCGIRTITGVGGSTYTCAGTSLNAGAHYDLLITIYASASGTSQSRWLLAHNVLAGGGPPTLQTATVEGARLELAYNKVLTGLAPPARAFAVTVGGSTRSISSIRLDGGTVVLTLASAVGRTDTVTVSYTAASAGDEPLRDAAGNKAVDLSRQAVTVVDTMVPVLLRAEVRGSELELVYDEALRTGALGALSFANTKVDGVVRNVTGARVRAATPNSVFLTLASPVTEGQAVLVNYNRTRLGPSLRIRDLAGNEAAALLDQPVKSDHTPPSLSTAAVEGTSLVLTYGEALAGSAPPAAAFAVTVAGNSRGVDSVELSGTAVTLTLASAVGRTDTVTVSYTAADAGDEPLRDAAGNKAADLSRQAVTHRDTTAPVLLRAEVRGSELELVYDEALRTGALGTLSFANTKVDGVVRNVTGARVRAATPNSVFLTLASPVTEGQAVLVNYNRTRLGPSLRIRDLAGNEAASLVDQPVKSDHTPPSLSTAAVEGTSLVLTYGEALAGSAPPAAAFAVTVAGNSRTIDSVELSGTAVTLTLASAVGRTDTVTVSYTVADAGDEPIRDAAGNKAADLSRQAVTVVDTMVPVLLRAEVRGSELELVYDEALRTGALGTLSFANTKVDGVVRNVTGARVRAATPNSVFLTLASPVTEGQAVLVNYNRTRLGPSLRIRDLAGNEAASLVDQPVKSDHTPPSLSTAAVEGTSLVLTYGEALAGSAPPAAAFAVTVAGNSRGVDSVELSGTAVTLTLASAVGRTDTVTVSYTAASAGDEPLRDAAGNKAVDLSRQAVTVVDTMVPVLLRAEVRGSELELVYDEALRTGALGALSFANTKVDGVVRNVTGARVRAATPNSVFLTLASPVTEGQAVLVNYNRTRLGPSLRIRDLAGNEAAALLDQPVKSDHTAPSLSTAAVGGTSLVLTYGEALAGSAPPAAAFAVTVAGNSRGVDSVELSGTAVTLTLASAVGRTDTVTVSYTAADAGDEPLRDAAGNKAVDLSRQAVTVVDTMVPVLLRAEVRGSELELVYDEALRTGALGALSFANTKVDGVVRNVTGARVRAATPNSVFLTLASPVTEGQAVLVNYNRTRLGPSLRIRDLAGNEAASLVDQPVKSDHTPPSLSTAAVEGTSLVLTYGEALAGSAPPAAAFAVTVAGNSRGVDSVELSGTAVTLTLASAVGRTDTVTVSYTAADAGDEPLRDAAGNKAVDLSRQAVTVVDTMVPVLLRAEVRGSELELVYDEALRTGALGALSFANTKVDGVVRNVTGARVRAATPNSVFLTLASPVTEGQAVLVNYNRTRLGPSLRIRDLAGNEAAALLDQPVKSDHTAPSLSTAAVGGTSLVLTYGEALAGSAPPAAAFAVTVAGNSRGVDSVELSGTAVTLTLASAVGRTDTVTVSYTAADAGDEPLRDAAGNKAADLSRQAVTVVDTMVPVLLRAEVRGSELELVYDEALRTGALGTLSFANTKVDGVVRNVTGARVRAATPNSAFLTLASPVTEGQAVLVNYNRTRLGPSLRIRDLAGNEAASLVDHPVKSDHTPPSLSTAAVEGTSLVLTYGEALAGSAPPAAAFAVTVAGNSRGVDSVELSGTAVTLTLASAVGRTDTVTVSYTAADAGDEPLRDAAGNKAADLTNQTVSNNTPLPAGGANFAHVTTTGSAPPDAPSSAVAVPGRGSGEITVRWQAAGTGPAVTRWEVQTGIGDGALTVKCSKTTGDTCTVTGLTPATAYTVRLDLYNGSDRRSLQARNVLSGDGAPVLSTAKVEGAALTLTFDRALGGSAPPAGAFAVLVAGTNRGVDSVALDGAAVTLTLAAAVAWGQTVTVTYTADDAGAQPIRSVGGHEAADVTNRAVTVIDQTPPELSTARVDGDSLVLTYNEALNTAAPLAAGFAVTVAGFSESVDSVALSGSAITLTLGQAVEAGEAAAVSYTAANAGDNPIRDAAGNRAADLDGHHVANTTPASGKFRTLSTSGSEAPGVPASASAEPGPGDGEITVTWANPTNPSVVGWNVRHKRRGTTEAFAASTGCQSQGANAAPGEFSCTATGLTPGAAYDLRLQVGRGSSNRILLAQNVRAGDGTAPALASASVDGDSLVLTYDEALGGTAPPAAAFAATVAGEDRGVTGVALEGMAVTLTLASAVEAAEAVTVSYAAAQAGANGIRDEAGNPAASLSGRKVTNKTDATDLERGTTTGTPPDVTAIARSGPRWRQITVEWEASGDTAVTGWDIWSREHGSGDAYVRLSQNLSPSVGSLTVRRPKAGTGYDLRLVFHAGAGNSLRLEKENVVSGENDETPPALSTATVDGAALTLTWNEPLIQTAPPAGAFAVTVAETARSVSGVEIDSMSVTLTLASAVTPGQAVTVSYTAANAGADTVRDEAGNPAPDLTRQTVTNVTPPVFSSATVTGATLEVTFDGPLDAASTPAATAFTVVVGSAADANPSQVSISGSVVTLTLATAAKSGQTVTVAYTVPAAGRLRGATGGDVASFSAKTATNATPPAFSSATVAGTALKITFDAALSSNSAHVPAPGRFDVQVAGSRVNVATNGVAVSAAVVTLTLSTAATAGQAVTVAYTKPTGMSAKPLQDGSGNEVETFTAQDVTNATPPVFSSATVTGATLEVTFDGPLDTTSKPATTAFTVVVGSAAGANPSAVSISGSVVTLTLATAAKYGQTVTVAYTVPTANKLRGATGGDVAAFSARTATNATPPAFSSATVAGTALKITFDAALSGNSAHVPAPGRFDVQVAGSRVNVAPNGVSVSGAVVTLTLASAATAGQAVTVAYTKPTGPGAKPLQDAEGKAVETFSARTATNATPPAFSSATVKGTALKITFDAALSGNSAHVPAPGRFNVQVAGSRVNVAANGVSVSGAVVTLTLASAVTRGQTVTVAYTKPTGPGAKPLQDGSGNEVETFSAQSVTISAAPVFSSATVAGTALKITFDVALSSNSAHVAPPAQFDVQVAGSRVNVAANGVSVSGAVVTLTLATAATAGQAVTVAYTKPTGVSAKPLQDAEGNAVDTFTAQVVTNATPPVYASATVTGTTLEVTFDGPLDTASTPAASAFTVVVGSAAGANPSAVSISGSVVTLTLATAATSGQTVTVAYTAPSTGKLRGATGGDVATFSAQTATNATPPAFASATVTGATLKVTFDGALEATSKPAATAFTVVVGSAAGTNPSAVSISGSVVTLTLASAARSGQTVTVAYTAPTTGKLQDAEGNAVETFSAQTATNATPPAFSSATVKGTALTVTFDAALSSNSAHVPAPGQFDVQVAGSRVNVAANGVSVSGSMVTLTLASAAKSGQTVTVAYTAPTTGKLQDAGGNAVETFSAQTATNATPPAFSSATVKGTALKITFDAALSSNSAHVPAPGRFNVQVAGSRVNVAANGVSVSAAVVTLTLATAVTRGQTVTVAYTKPTGASAKPLQDGSGNEVETFAAQSVTNSEAPVFSSATVAGTTLKITFDATLSSNSAHVPPPGQFDVQVAGSRVNVAANGVSVSGAVVTLTLATAATAGQAVTVAYTKPTGASAKPLQDAEGNAVDTFTAQNVTNATPPVYASATVTGTTLEVTFDGPLDTASTPAASAFTVVVGSAAGANPSQVSISGSVVTLTLATAAKSGQTVTVAYTAPSTGKLRGATGGDVTTFSAQTVTNATPPAFSSAAVNGSALTVTFDAALDTSSAPKGTVFSVKATRAGATSTINGGSADVTISGSTVSVTLATAVEAGATVTVSYVKPTVPAQGDPLQDASQNEVEPFTDRTATNNTPPEVSVSASTGTLAESKGATFEVRLNGATGQTVTVDYALTGTATHGTDYTSTPAAASGTLTFTPGTTLRAITLAATADGVDEADETVIVTLSNVSTSATLGTPSTAQLSISDYVPTAGVAEVVTLEIVSNPGADLMYAPGDTVRVALTFSEAVNVGLEGIAGEDYGKPRLDLKMDPSMGTRRAIYESGGGTDRLVFAYTLKAWDMVPTGNTAIGLGVVENSLELNCGRIRSAVSGNWALLAHRGLPPDAAHRLTVGTPDLSGDTAWPRWQDSWLNGTWLTIEFDEPLDPNHTPPGSAFTVVISTRSPVGRWQGTGTAIVAANEVRVKLAEAVTHVPGSSTVHYSVQTAGGSGLRDLAGNWVPGHPYGHGIWTLRHNSPPVMAQQAQAVEGQAVAFELALAEPPTSAATVDYETGDGTAVAGEDYEAASGTMTFVPGETKKTVRVRALADGAVEGAETLRLRLMNPAGLVLAEGGAEATGTIRDAGAGGGAAVAIVSDPGDDRTYGRGDTIRVRLTFAAAVAVDTAGGTPRLKIKMDPDSGETWAVYESGSGTSELVFAFGPVAAPDLSPRGIAVLADTLEANGGNIRLADTEQDAPLAHAGLAHDPNHKVDHRVAAPPELASAEVSGTTLTLTFDEILDPKSAPAGSAFTVTAIPSAGGEGHALAGSGSASFADDGLTVTVTLADAVAHGESATVAYAVPDDNPLQDLAGNPVAAFSDQPAANGTPDTTPPTLASAEVSGTTLTLTFDEPLDPAFAAAGSAFTVTATSAAGGESRAVAGSGSASFAADGLTVTVALAAPAAHGETTTVAYAVPDDNPLQDLAGNPVAAFSDQPVANGTPDTTPATLASAEVSSTTLTLTFDEALDPASAPAGSAFTVTATPAAGGDSRALVGSGSAAFSADGLTVTVTLTAAVAHGETATVTYAVPVDNPLQDLAGNRATAFSDQAAANATPDTTPPALASAQVSGTTLTLAFDKALDPASAPAGSAFTVTATPAAGSASRALAGSGSATFAANGLTVTVTLATAVGHGDTTTVAYAIPDDNPLQDLAGNPVAAFSDQPAANATPDTTPPALASAEVSGTTLTLAFDEALDPASVPAGSAFTVTATSGGGESRALAGSGSATIADDGLTVTVTLAAAVAHGDTTTVAYAIPDHNPLQDLVGNPVAAFSAQPAANTTPLTVGLTVAGAGTPEWFPVRVSFSGPVTGPPELSAGTVGGDEAAVTEVAEAMAGRAWTARVAASGPSRMWVRAGAVAAAAGDVESAPVVLVVDVDADGNATPVAGPAVVAVTIAEPANGTSWVAGEEVGVWLVFSEPVTVDTTDGTPSVAVAADGAAVRAVQRGGFGMSWRFAWTVPAGGSVAHVALAADSLALDGATIRDGAGRDADLKHPGAERGSLPEKEPVTAAFINVPAAHPGPARLFGFSVKFSRAADLNAFALGVEGGHVAQVAPLVRGREEIWAVLAMATGDGPVTFSLAAREGGPALGNAPRVVVPGPAPVEEVVEGLTASFEDLPPEHDGKRLFRFELRFSEDFPGRFDYRRLRDHAFQVENGQVRDATRVAQGQNRRWTIAVRPASYEDVTIVLPAATDCAAPGAVCTEAGEKLTNTVRATVAGPAAISVADARAQEGVDDTIDFAVTLHKTAAGVVTVDYETVDGTAKAGEDYVAASGTLTFAAGETGKTVAVTVLDDARDEGEETFRLRLSNPHGAYVADRVAVGTIVNTDPLQQAWLARYGRTVGAQAIDAIGARFAGGAAAGVTVGGHALAAGGGTAPEQEYDGGGLEAWRAAFGWEEPAEDSRAITGRELLHGSSFDLAVGGEEGGPRVGAWGRFAMGSFDAQLDGLTVSGEATTAFLGADVAGGPWLGGLALSVSQGEGPFTLTGAAASNRRTGSVGSTLAAVWPYVRLQAHERLSLWAMAGLGRGTLSVAEDGAAPLETGVGMLLGAGGAHGALIAPGPEGGLALALRSDAMWARIDSEAVRNLAATEAEVTRLRLILDASWMFALGLAGTLTPALQAGVRQDGGDAETGTGLELGARIDWAAGGVSVAGSVRALVAHEEAGYDEWGASAALRIDPGADGRGLSLTLAPAWGDTASSAERLWGARAARALAAGGEFQAQSRLLAELGYGLGIVTPFAGLELAGEESQTWRAGARWQLGPYASLDLEGTRSTTTAGAAPEHGLTLSGSLRW